MEGYRVVTTSYVYVRDADEAKKLALKGRGEGKRTEIITEDEYAFSGKHGLPMQDLSNWPAL